MATKVTSFESSTGAPTPPNQTPCTEATDVDSLPETDLAAVGQILEPVREALNEAAEDSLYPSPPDNTPAFTSPAPSVHGFNYGQVRGRGLSVIGDRLAQLKMGDRASSPRDNDSSTESVAPSSQKDDEAEKERDVSDGNAKPDMVHNLVNGPLIIPTGSGGIPVNLGSPALNPRIQEYLAFQSDDLPATTPAGPISNDNGKDHPVSAANSVTSIKSEAKSIQSAHYSIHSDGGVIEKSNWAEEVIELCDRALSRLEQLAEDEATANPNMMAKDVYFARLKELLASDKRKCPLVVIQKEKKE